MLNYYIRFIAALGFLDFIWLSLTFTKQKIFYESIQQSSFQVDKLAMILFYLLAPFAFIYFIQPLSVSKTDALKKGCLMGFLMYMTFDLTCKAIFSKFTWDYAVKDMLWGTFVIGLSSYLSY